MRELEIFAIQDGRYIVARWRDTGHMEYLYRDGVWRVVASERFLEVDGWHGRHAYFRTLAGALFAVGLWTG